MVIQMIDSLFNYRRDEYPAHDYQDVFEAWVYTIKNRDVLSRERIDEYGFYWELKLSVWYARGNLYPDYHNGHHPADEILASVEDVADRMDE